MLSQTAEYALRATVHLAAEPLISCTAIDIAHGVRAPLGYLTKVLARLARAGLVVGRRGRHGGFMLARPARSISMFDVIAASDPPASPPRCPFDHDAQLGCPLYLRLGQALALEQRFYRTVTLQHLLSGQGHRAGAEHRRADAGPPNLAPPATPDKWDHPILIS